MALFFIFVSGFGFCFAYIPSVVIVGLYFDKRRSLAMGIAVSGCGFGSLVFAPLFQYLVDVWGWRGALLLSAGISAHTCVLGALLRPIEEHIPRCISIFVFFLSIGSQSAYIREVKISLRHRVQERNFCLLTSSFLVFFLGSYSLSLY